MGADSVKFGGPKRVIWHACCAQFGTLGTIERCRGTWEQTEGGLGVPGLHFYRFGKDFGAAIWTFLANFGTTIVFFGMRVCRSRFLKILGSDSGCLGLQNQGFGGDVLQKPAFHICRDYVDFGIIFTWFPMTLGPILMTFGGLGAGLKHHDFRWFSWGAQS